MTVQLPVGSKALLSKLAYQFVPELIPQVAEIAESISDETARIETLLELAEAANTDDRRSIAATVLRLIMTVDAVDSVNSCVDRLRRVQGSSSIFRSIRFLSIVRNVTNATAAPRRSSSAASLLPLRDPCAEIAECLERRSDEVGAIIRGWSGDNTEGKSACFQRLLQDVSKEDQESFLKKISLLGPLIYEIEGASAIGDAIESLQLASAILARMSYPINPDGKAREVATGEPYREFRARLESEDVGGISETQLYRPRLSNVQYVRRVLGFV